MRRRGSVAEIAKTAAFLLSEDSGYITGAKHPRRRRVDQVCVRRRTPENPIQVELAVHLLGSWWDGRPRALLPCVLLA